MTAVRVGSNGSLSRLVGIDLDAYRERHVSERIGRAVVREGAGDVAGLVRLLRTDEAARQRFRRSLAVSVSGVFRDPQQFDLLEGVLLPPLVATGKRLRVWSAGCADGAELYSVAMVLERLGALDRTHLLGSDLLEENVEAARRAHYGTAVPDTLRPRVRWEVRDLLRDGAPAGSWNVVLCRNVAIYLAPHARDALHATLAGALSRDGVLLVGRSEAIRAPGAIGLEPVAHRAYRRVR